MRKTNTVPVEIPLVLPRPISVDDIKVIRPNLFLFQPREATNANRPRPHSRGNSGTAPIRIVFSCSYFLNPLIDAFLHVHRPEYERCFAPPEEFYDRTLRDGADVVFLLGRYWECLQRLKLDPILSDIPVVIVDSVEVSESLAARDDYLRAGADAVLFVPIDPASILKAMDLFLPPYAPSTSPH